LWVFIPLLKEGFFIINFIPPLKGFEWFLFVMKNNSLDVSSGQPMWKQMISA